MERALEITAANGTRYKFIEAHILGTVVYAYAWYCNKWNRLSISFHSLDEAEAWVREINRKHEAQKNAPQIKTIIPQNAYYTITGYYGD